jgi:hypothetical protein
MSDIPADDGPAAADDDHDAGIDADAFSPVMDPDYVPAQTPQDNATTSDENPGRQDRDSTDD